MVGLADIPFLGKIVDKIVDKISDIAVEALYRGLQYMFCYKALVDGLNSETGKLHIEKEKLSRKIKEEEDNGKIIEDYVLKWQNDVDEIQKSPEEFSPSCSCIQSLPIPNPVSRFRQGRNAAKKAKTVTELTICGKDYLNGEIAHLPPVKYMPKSDTTFEEFQSRKDTYEKLRDGLVNKDSPLVHGIYGMAGVGKTRMMEKIWVDTMDEKIFDKVVRVNVGNENMDMIKLQDQIASRLDCNLESQDVDRRASQLENSLGNAGKILLILDDVWREIPLGNIIGTSFGDGSSSKGSKILLTSRERVTLLLNKCKNLVEIKTLSPEEALYLFKNTVGPDTINSVQDESLVQKVCDECGHLPLLIHAVGKALQGEPHNLWKDAHDQLKKGKFEKIVGVDPQVYTCIKLSIDNLKDEDAKSCLFLCSMFPEDANIDMRMLIQLATGSQLIPDGELRVLAMVHYLKISSLLLDSGDDKETKVHDIIRDVARSIAFTDSRYAFLQVICNSQYLPSDANYCTRKFLRLDVETDDLYFDEDLVCPDLHSLWLQSNAHPQRFSGGFFSMFVKLRFLVLQNVNISFEQFSLQSLGNLGTLTLLKCDIRKTDVSLFPKSLKTLCICYCDLPQPLDVANLKYLRKLEIRNGKRKLVMASNVKTSLPSLEELHIPSGFIIDLEEFNMEPIVMEISKLTHLRSLEFHFYDDATFQGTNVFSNVDKYNIYVGDPEKFYSWERNRRVPSTKSIQLYGNHSQAWEGLMARAEEVKLRSSDVEVSNICNGHTRAFEDLKKLFITECDNMGQLASRSHDEIQYSIQSATYFSKLTFLKVDRCSKLKYLFCNNIAKRLVQLQNLTVEKCGSMEAIIMNEGTRDGETISFPKLKLLEILDMSRLASFYAEKKEMHSGSALPMDNSAQYQPLFDGKVAFPSLERLLIRDLPNTSVIWGKEFCDDTVSSFRKLNSLSVIWCDKLEIMIPVMHRLHNLESITVSGCSSLRTLFSPSVARDFTHLRHLSVEKCGEMREIIEPGEQVITDDGILFPKLTYLRLEEMRSLTSFWCYQSGKANTRKVPLILPQLSSISLRHLPAPRSVFHGANFDFHMPSLKDVQVTCCDFLTLFTFSTFRTFQLEELDITSCEMLEKIVEDPRGDETCDKIITLSQLKGVGFFNSPKLKSFFHNANYEFYMPVLAAVCVDSCGFSDSLFKCSIFRNFDQLEILMIRDCGLLEGIFEDVKGDETSDLTDRIITLSRLSSLILEDLPSLKSFCYGKYYEFNMPALTDAKVVNCGLSTLFTGSVQQLKELEVVDCRLLEHIVDNSKGDETSNTNNILCPELTTLKLVKLPSLTSFWFQQSGKANTCKVAFRLLRLSSIVLEYLPGLKSFFHGANFEFHMPVLKTVEVRDCGLSNSLFTRSVSINLKQLEELSICDCELLESIFEEAGCDETLDMSDKIITLNRVSGVHLQGLPKLKSIFCDATYKCYMPALEYVGIVGCGISVLFTCSMFQEIQLLRDLHVANCLSLEHIVEEVAGDETSEINGKSITFSQLSSITLESLPNLKSFSCTSSFVFYMPKLQNFDLIECPQIEYISFSNINTSLVRVTSDWCSGETFQDLNDFIRQNHKRVSYSTDNVGESSYSNQELETESERIEEEEKSHGTEIDQADS